MMNSKLKISVPTTRDWLRRELKNLSKNSDKSKVHKLSVLDVGGGIGRVWQDVDEDNWLSKNNIQLEVTILDSNDFPISQSPNRSITFSSSPGVVPTALDEFLKDSFDLVTAFDVIEHLPKHDGYLLLYGMHRISACSAVRAPNGFVWQPPFVDNPYQAHVSSWRPRELRRMGWTIQYGDSGPRWLIGIGTFPKYLLSSSRFRKVLNFVERLAIFLGKLLFVKTPSASAEFVAVRRTRSFDLELEIKERAKTIAS